MTREQGPEEDLTDLRSQIAAVTKEIIKLAGKRKELAREAGAAKSRAYLPLEDEAVEDSLLADVLGECDRVGLDRSVGLKLLSTLLADSKRAQGLSRQSSGASPAAVFSKVAALQRQGRQFIRLDIGEPDFPPPNEVVEACAEAMRSRKTHYTQARGIPELTTALRQYLARTEKFEASDAEVAVTPGGRFAVYAALASVASEGDSVVMAEPAWPAYREVMVSLGVKPIAVHTRIEDGWLPTLSQIEAAVRPNTKAIILSYPNNPTGSVISEGFFREVTDLADSRGLTVISDEVYQRYSVKPSPSILGRPPRKFVLVSSFSKTWAMTGFRVGYAVSTPDIAEKIVKQTSLLVTSVPEFIQWGAIKALDADSDAKRNAEEVEGRIAAASEALDSIEGLRYARPSGGIYVFPALTKPGVPAGEFAERLLDKGVSVTPGLAFGDYPQNFRVSLVQPKERLVEGIRRMGELLH